MLHLKKTAFVHEEELNSTVSMTLQKFSTSYALIVGSNVQHKVYVWRSHEKSVIFGTLKNRPEEEISPGLRGYIYRDKRHFEDSFEVR